jgi:hypothetical protein
MTWMRDISLILRSASVQNNIKKKVSEYSNRLSGVQYTSLHKCVDFYSIFKIFCFNPSICSVTGIYPNNNNKFTKFKSPNPARNSLIKGLHDYISTNQLMAATREQFACLCVHRAADYKPRVVRECIIVSENSDLAGKALMRDGSENGSFDMPFRCIASKRNALIAHFMILVLLVMLQTTVCSDDVIASELARPAAVDQRMQQEEEHEADTPVTGGIETATTMPEIREPATDIATPLPLIELSSIAPVSGPGQSVPGVENEVKASAEEALTAIAGSNFMKISNSGEILDDNATTWECVEDKRSKLTWEVKKNDGGIRDKDYSYSWLRKINGETRGAGDGGRCNGGVNCDTYSYVSAMNEQKLCGYSDWRLPTREEMETLVEYNTSAKDPAINTRYFPETVPSWYWTATENPRHDNFAWYLLFRNGIALNDLKERPKHVRLVRGDRTQ